MDSLGRQVKVLNRDKAKFDSTKHELAKVDLSGMFAGKETSGNWVAFKRVMIKSKHVLVRVKGKAADSKDPWMMRN